MPDTPTARLHADVDAAQAHHAAVQLGYTGHKELAERLTETWAVFGAMPQDEPGPRTIRVSWAPEAVRGAGAAAMAVVAAMADTEGELKVRGAGGTDGGLIVAGRALMWTDLACLADAAEAVLVAMADGDVRALPPEPEVGRTVEVIGGDRAGQRMQRTDEDRIYRWRMPSGVLSAWPTPLIWAGPAGVRVLDGE